MTDIQERLATGKGKFTPRYPELGTDPVTYEDSISPEFFADERQAVFERSWLYVGRAERVPHAARPRHCDCRALTRPAGASMHDGGRPPARTPMGSGGAAPVVQ